MGRDGFCRCDRPHLSNGSAPALCPRKTLGRREASQAAGGSRHGGYRAGPKGTQTARSTGVQESVMLRLLFTLFLVIVASLMYGYIRELNPDTVTLRLGPATALELSTV